MDLVAACIHKSLGPYVIHDLDWARDDSLLAQKVLLPGSGETSI